MIFLCLFAFVLAKAGTHDFLMSFWASHPFWLAADSQRRVLAKAGTHFSL
jgi:hypothetical protein